MTDPRTLREEISAGLPLTEQECDVLEHAAHGRRSADTAAAMFLADETVKSYRKSAVAKLAARNTTHAVVIAVGMGYIDISQVVDQHERRMAEEGGNA